MMTSGGFAGSVFSEFSVREDESKGVSGCCCSCRLSPIKFEMAETNSFRVRDEDSLSSELTSWRDILYVFMSGKYYE